jgi:hypothetical protein
MNVPAEWSPPLLPVREGPGSHLSPELRIYALHPYFLFGRAEVHISAQSSVFMHFTPTSCSGGLRFTSQPRAPYLCTSPLLPVREGPGSHLSPELRIYALHPYFLFGRSQVHISAQSSVFVHFTKYYEDDQIKGDNMGRACSKHAEMKNAYKITFVFLCVCV